MRQNSFTDVSVAKRFWGWYPKRVKPLYSRQRPSPPGATISRPRWTL